MRVEPSKLAKLMIAYREKFGRYVPESALRLLAAEKLAAILQDSLATGVPLAKTGWDSSIEFGTREFRLDGCIIPDENSGRVMSTKGPDDEWLH